MAKESIEGHTGLLSVYRTAAYKPLVCLISTSLERSAVTTEKTNYCTEGKTETKVKDVTKTVSFEAEFTIDDEETNIATYKDMAEICDSKEDEYYKLDGRGEPLYFKAIIASLSDTFPGEGDATFSGTLNINGDISATDPKAGG